MATKKQLAQTETQLATTVDQLKTLLDSGVIRNAEDKAKALELLAKYEALEAKFGRVKSGATFIVLTVLLGMLVNYAVQFAAVSAAAAMLALTGSVIVSQLAYWAVVIVSFWLVLKFGDTFLNVVLTVADWIATGYLWLKGKLVQCWNWVTGWFSSADEATA